MKKLSIITLSLMFTLNIFASENVMRLNALSISSISTQEECKQTVYNQWVGTHTITVTTTQNQLVKFIETTGEDSFGCEDAKKVAATLNAARLIQLISIQQNTAKILQRGSSIVCGKAYIDAVVYSDGSLIKAEEGFSPVKCL
jgi:hypothetical protein